LDARALARLLASILYLSEKTILVDIYRNPESLPPPEKWSGQKKKVWEIDSVVGFYPPNIGAAIRRTWAREFESGISKKPMDLPPPMPTWAGMLGQAE
jgi:hypothetical protein